MSPLSTAARSAPLEKADVDERAPLWLFGDQLGPAVHGLRQHADREIVLVESSSVLRRRRYHRQKLHLVLSGMRHLDDELGDRSTYHRARTYREALPEVGRPVIVHQPTSWAATAFVEDLRRGVWSRRSCRPRRSPGPGPSSMRGPATG